MATTTIYSVSYRTLPPTKWQHNSSALKLVFNHRKAQQTLQDSGVPLFSNTDLAVDELKTGLWYFNVLLWDKDDLVEWMPPNLN